MQMPFGKHRGEQLGNIPRDYLLWVPRQLQQLVPDAAERNQADTRNRAAVLFSAPSAAANTPGYLDRQRVVPQIIPRVPSRSWWHA